MAMADAGGGDVAQAGTALPLSSDAHSSNLNSSDDDADAAKRIRCFRRAASPTPERSDSPRRDGANANAAPGHIPTSHSSQQRKSAKSGSRSGGLQPPSSSSSMRRSSSGGPPAGSSDAIASAPWNPVHSLMASLTSLFAPPSITVDNVAINTQSIPPVSPLSISAHSSVNQNVRQNSNAHQPRHSHSLQPLDTQRRHSRRAVLNDADFYGVDFGPPPATDTDIAIVSTRRSSISAAQVEREDKIRLQQGSVFISALNNMIVSRKFDSTVTPPRSPPQTALNPDVDVSSISNMSDYASHAGSDESKKHSRTSNSRYSSHLQRSEQSQSERIASATDNDAPEKTTATNDAQVETGGRRLVNTVQQRMQQLDYSDVFPLDIGEIEGVSVFRIESLMPVLLDADQTGKFCIADCYIVLHVHSIGTDTDNNNGTLEHHIYTWIGSEAEMDKKFCAAMFSVGLRNWIGATCRVIREVEGEESPEFLAIFHTEINYDDVTQATESGLYVAEQKRYPLRLYMLRGRLYPELCLAKPSYQSLRSDAVFLLDWGLELFIWNGSVSPLQHRAKCRMVCDRINKLERVGRAVVVELDEWSESTRFWDILGGERVHNATVKTDKNDAKNGDANVQDGVDDTGGEENDAKVEDFEARDNEEENQNQEAAADVDGVAEPSDTEDEVEDNSKFEALIQSPQVLYRGFPKMAPELESHIVATNQLKRSVLVADGCYVLDAGVELFLWIGKESWPQLRTMTTELLAKIVSSRDRPKWIGFTKCFDGHEPEVFKLRFPDWDRAKMDKINWQDVVNGIHAEQIETHRTGTDGKPIPDTSTDTKSKIRVDVKALYAPPPTLDIDSILIEDTIDHANRLLQAFTSFVFHRGRFVQLPEGERGHFFSQDAYVFLCVYRVDTRERVAERTTSSGRGSKTTQHVTASTATSTKTSPDRLHASAHTDDSLTQNVRGSDTKASSVSGSGADIRSSAHLQPGVDLADKEGSGRKSRGGSRTSDQHASDHAEDGEDDMERSVDKDNTIAHTIHKSDSENLRHDYDDDQVFHDDNSDDHDDEIFDEDKESSYISNTDQAEAAPKPVLECIVYFWQGRHASKLSISTFKLKTQQEMEQLVLQMYESPVRVVHLHQGKEPIALLAHLDNMCVFRAGSRAEWLSQMEARAALRRDDRSLMDASRPSQLDAKSSSSRIAVKGGSVGPPCALFQIRSDLKYKTVRAIEVPSVASSLVSRDCFFLQVFDFSVCDGDTDRNTDGERVSNGPPARRRHYLWVGKGASKEDVQRARIIASVALSFSHTAELPLTPPGAAFPDDEIELDDTVSSNASIAPPMIETVAEKLEPRAFWSYLGGRGVYAADAVSVTTRPPRFLRCSCTQGYFLVEEVPLFCQSDCQPDSCVILDPGAPHKLYVWIGSDTSDVVRKLTRKSVEVWLDRLDDGRIADFEQSSPTKTEFSAVSPILPIGDVVWIVQDREPLDFRAFFHGWDARVAAATVDPGSQYLRQQQRERELRKKASAVSAQSAFIGV